MKNILNCFTIFIVIILISGCAPSTSNDSILSTKIKPLVSDINEITIIWAVKNRKQQIQYRKNKNKNLLETCKRNTKFINDYFYKNHKINYEFQMRNMKIKSLNNATHKYILLIFPIQFISKDRNDCKPISYSILSEIYNIEGLSKLWYGPLTKTKIKELVNNSSKEKVYDSIITLDMTKSLDEAIGKFRKLLINDLYMKKLIPKKLHQ